MNSLVSVDKNEQRSRFSVLGDREDEGEDLQASANPRGGNVVLFLPKENVVRNEDSDECIPIMVDNVPVYLSQSSNGSPLYIRQYPPTLEDLLLRSPANPSPSFDGFSEASGSTFDGFSEASYCSSVTFEGFLDDQDDSEKAEKVNVSVPVSTGEGSDEVLPGSVPVQADVNSDKRKTLSSDNSVDGKASPALSSDISVSKQPAKSLVKSPGRDKDTSSNDAEVISFNLPEPSRKARGNATPPSRRVKTRSYSCDSRSVDPKESSEAVVEKKPSPSPRRVTRSSSCDSKGKNSDGLSESSVNLKRQNSREVNASSKKLKLEETHENVFKSSNSETLNVQPVEPEEKNAYNVLSPRSRRSAAKNENHSSSNPESPRKTRGRWRMTEVEKETPVEEVIRDESQNFIGEMCNSVGCTISFLESMKIKHVPICNGIIYELSEFARRIAWERTDVALWIQRLSGIQDGNPTLEDLDKIHNVLRRRKALKVTLAGQKIGGTKLRAFDSTEFVLPSAMKNGAAEQMHPIGDLQEKYEKRKRNKKKMEIMEEDDLSGKEDINDKMCNNKVIDYKNKFTASSENKKQYRERELCDKYESKMEEISGKKRGRKKKKGKRVKIKKEPDSRKTGPDCNHEGASEDCTLQFEMNNSTDDDFDYENQVKDEYPQEYEVNRQTGETKCTQSGALSEGKDLKDSEEKTGEFDGPHLTPDSSVGTLGVSKSGRLRKASARGIQSIEIKSLFMQNNVPSTLAMKSETGQEGSPKKLKNCYNSDDCEEDYDFEKIKVKRSCRFPKDPANLYKGVYINRYKRLLQSDSSVVSFTFQDGHVIPKFKEIDYYLGDYCCEAGVTVDDINSDDKKDVDMTVGMVKELHDFYVSRGASKTSLALRLMKMSSVDLIDYTQLLSTVLSINKAAKTDRLDFNQLQREFKFPRRQSGLRKRDETMESNRKTNPNSYLVSEKRRSLLQVPGALRNTAFGGIKKKFGHHRKMVSDTKARSSEYDDLALDVEIVRASLKVMSQNADNKKPKLRHSRKYLKRMQRGTFAKGVDLTDDEIFRTRTNEQSEIKGLVKRKVGRPRKNFVQKPANSRTEEVNSLHDSKTAVRELGIGDAVIKKNKGGRPRKKPLPVPASGDAEDMNFALDNEIVRTRGKEGSVTRGDIVYLYTQWLRNKMAVGSNVFVTDLLKDVEQLMAERRVHPIRIPAGTLMSSSVRLHDEYKQMLTVSKEDAMLYLEEDWLEDIQYLVSISGPSRRSTIEGDTAGNSFEKIDVDGSLTHPDTMSDSDFSERSLVIDDSVKSDDSSTGEKAKVWDKLNTELVKSKSNVAVTNKKLYVGERASYPRRGRKLKTSREPSGNNRGRMLRSRMESVGKRTRRLSVRHSLEDYELEEFPEVKVETPREHKDRQFARSRGRVSRNFKGMDDCIYTEEDYDVEKIVDYEEVYDKNRGKHLKYLVRWLGFGAEDDSWVDEADLQCPELLDEFWKIARKERYSRKKKPLSNNLTALSAQNHESSEMPENLQTKDSTHFNLGGSDKENGGNIIVAMTQHASLENYSNPRPSKEAKRFVTRRELLDLYDNWRQENQNGLMAGGSNTVNLEIFVSKVKDLMASRRIEHFHADSLLNACFMMTLMRGRLKTEKALNIFLESSCSEVLEASRKQYLMTQHNSSIGEMQCGKNFTNKDITIYSLQNDLQRMQCDLSAAMRFRSANRCVLGVLEEEVDCLENIFKASQESHSNIGILLQRELELLKEDLNSLENKNSKGSNSMASNAKSCKTRKGPRLKSPISLTEFGSDKLREPVLQAGQKLLNFGVPSQKIDSMIELVVNKISGQRLRAQPAGVRSIAEEVGLVHI